MQTEKFIYLRESWRSLCSALLCFVHTHTQVTVFICISLASLSVGVLCYANSPASVRLNFGRYLASHVCVYVCVWYLWIIRGNNFSATTNYVLPPVVRLLLHLNWKWILRSAEYANNYKYILRDIKMHICKCVHLLSCVCVCKYSCFEFSIRSNGILCYEALVAGESLNNL